MRLELAAATILSTVLAGAAMPGLVGAADAPDSGRVKAEACLGCHGIESYRNAYPSYRVPKIGGQSEAYLVAALKAYRSGDRAHPTMQAQSATLTDEDIAELAAFFAGDSGSDNQE